MSKDKKEPSQAEGPDHGAKKNEETKSSKKATSKKVELTKIPLKDVLYVEIDDEVGGIFDRLQAKTSKTVYLVVPKRSVLFQSIINVKILSRKASDIDKKIAFVTKDKSGIFFANKCNIKVYDSVSEDKKELNAEDISEPLTETLDDVKFGFSRGRPTKTEHEKKSISEITEEKLQEPFVIRVRKFLREGVKNRKKKNTRPKSSVFNRPVFASMIVASAFLLFLITYIALPNATVVIKPNLVPISERVRVTLLDSEKNENLLRSADSREVPSYPINPGFLEKTIDFKATGVDPDAPRSTGSITILNKESDNVALIPDTRFVTSDGVIFRIKNYVALYGGSEAAPSTATVEVYAAEADINGLPIGSKGNIKDGTELYVLNFDETRRKTFYALANGNFEGGITSDERIVTEADIEAAKAMAAKELTEEITNLLADIVREQNRENGTNLTFLEDREAINLGEAEVFIGEDIVGRKVDVFQATARIQASGVAFDRDEFLEILRDKITLRQSPDKTLTEIDEEGVTYNVVSVDFENGITEVDAQISGVEKFNLSLDKQAGMNLHKKIQEHIVGLTVDEATSYVENLPQVESATIKTWPFWAPTVPASPKNIKIQIVE